MYPTNATSRRRHSCSKLCERQVARHFLSVSSLQSFRRDCHDRVFPVRLVCNSSGGSDSTLTESRYRSAALVTGANKGIGLEIARGLYQDGFVVLLACRDISAAAEARDEILRSGSNKNNSGSSSVSSGDLGDVVIIDSSLDLEDLSSVQVYAQEVTSKFQEEGLLLQVLVNNAGVMAAPFSRTRQGIERHFGVNHLAHFLLTKALLPLLRDASSKSGTPSRVVTQSSNALLLVPSVDTSTFYVPSKARAATAAEQIELKEDESVTNDIEG